MLALEYKDKYLRDHKTNKIIIDAIYGKLLFIDSWQLLLDLFLTAPLSGKYYYLYSMHEKTSAQKGQITCPEASI